MEDFQKFTILPAEFVGNAIRDSESYDVESQLDGLCFHPCLRHSSIAALRLLQSGICKVLLFRIML